ncbi:MAG: PspC domain-containing protein [Acidimicrobiales bacterium]|jgi:signal transduction histidine kinase
MPTWPPERDHRGIEDHQKPYYYRVRHGRRWHPTRGPLRRSADDRMVAGVCGAISRRLGVDVTIVRVVFVLVALSSFGVAAYVLAWLFIPLEGDHTNIASRALNDLRGIAMAIAFVPLLVIGLLVASALGASWLTSLSWSVIISAAGLVLVWRNADDAEKALLHRIAAPLADLVTPGSRSRQVLGIRLLLGALLLSGGLALLLVGHKTSAGFKPLGGLLLVIGAIVVVFGPWWLRLARDLVAERQARARAEERADMASRVHDSVLQTLALIQKQADHPQQVVQLARAQERELRSWLFEGQPLGSTNEQDLTFGAGVQRIQHEVEASHGTTVDVVVVGDCPLDEQLRGMLAAGKEATVNAAKWSGAPVVSLYAEIEASGVSMFVRDRGVGFDPDQVPADRKGITESVQARMARLGGSATIRSAPGEGTEVALSLPLARGGHRPHAAPS